MAKSAHALTHPPIPAAGRGGGQRCSSRNIYTDPDNWPPRRCHMECQSDACMGGRMPCPCPEACERPVMTDRDRWHIWSLLIAVAAVWVCAAVVMVTWN